ncbi:MAG: ATP-binding protein [Porticoccus sp.]
MKKYLITIFLLLVSHPLYAGVVSHFKDEEGHTDWQHVANWSSGILILLLSMTAITLFFSRREAHKSNRELETIRRELEQRVRERTATLDESNHLLTRTNQLLEGEITQHRQTTAQLRSSEAYISEILSSMPLMLIGLDPSGQITQWNRRAEEITGIDSEQALGKDLWQTYPAITVTPNQLTQAQEENRTLTIKHSQRGQYHFDITIYPLQDQIETGVVILIDDVTQHILSANMLIQRDKMSSMGELASTMAHDINSPLQGILHDLEKGLNELEMIPLDAGTSLRDLLTDASNEGQQALAIINNLLDFSHSRGGEQRITDVTEVIEHTLTLANDVLSVPSGLRFRDITIERHYDKNLPKIPCFVSELQQVFLSLFRHACHALGQRQGNQHPTIKIQVIECYETLWIKVQHNGVGISYEEQQFIFEPFFTDRVSDEDYDAGKRLSFSHFIITEQHRGELAVTSDLNVGTTFHIQLPLSQA